jgi:dihydrofolate reductase
LKAILHADREWGIGKDNKLMFSIPADMKFFRQTTTGNVVVMGRNTLNSFPEGKPLKNRVNIVLSTHSEQREGCIFVNGLGELFAALAPYDDDKIFVIGGMQVYKLLLPYCSEVLVTKVDAVGGADAFFENLDLNPDFELVSLSEDEITNGFKINFATYKNNKVKNYK